MEEASITIVSFLTHDVNDMYGNQITSDEALTRHSSETTGKGKQENIQTFNSCPYQQNFKQFVTILYHLEDESTTHLV